MPIPNCRRAAEALLPAIAATGADQDLVVVLRPILAAAASLDGTDLTTLDVLDPAGGVRLALVEPPEGSPARSVAEDQPLTCVPVLAQARSYGTLTISRRPAASTFTQDDEQVLLGLASVAGLALQKAELQQQSERREQWLQAAGDLTTHLLGGASVPDVLADLVARARRLADADVALLALPAGDGVLRVEAVDGAAAEELRGGELVQHSLRAAAATMRDGGTIVVADDRVQPHPGLLKGVGAGPVVYVPLGTAGDALGALVLARVGDRSGFDDEIVRLVEGFAAQAAVALRLGAAAVDRAQLVMSAERDRIARDLHDVVIQQLFATGMSLQSVLPALAPSKAGVRVGRAVGDIDATIREIRTSIFALHGSRRQGTTTLRASVLAAVASAQPALGCRPTVQFRGPVDTLVPAAVAEHVLAVAHEALSNAARHAGATAVSLTLLADARWVELVVEDDGRGVLPGGRRSGLADLAPRAAGLGGSFSVTRAPGGGTRLSWSAPLDPASTTSPARPAPPAAPGRDDESWRRSRTGASQAREQHLLAVARGTRPDADGASALVRALELVREPSPYQGQA